MSNSEHHMKSFYGEEVAKINPALKTPKHTARLLPAPFAKLTLGGNRLRQLVLPLLATRERDLGGWFSIVFSINFSSFFHQSQLFCGGNSMGCDPEPSTEYPSGGLLPNCSSNPFLLLIPHPRYGPLKICKFIPQTRWNSAGKQPQNLNMAPWHLSIHLPLGLWFHLVSIRLLESGQLW